jgi:hypothetical protein
MPAPRLAEHPHLHPASPAGEYRLRQRDKSGAALTSVCATTLRNCRASGGKRRGASRVLKTQVGRSWFDPSAVLRAGRLTMNGI